MPYHLEKGPLLRIIERHINADRSTMQQHLAALVANTGPPLAWLDLVAGLWADPAFNKPNAVAAQLVKSRIATEWFGYTPAANGWAPPDPALPTTGYWIGYTGDVEAIVRKALVWAMELALGKGSSNPAGKPWPIELFWKCPTPWFETWVSTRKVPNSSTGLVTVTFLSPSHNGAIVADSPLAVSAVASPQGGGHPVPSWEDDYEWLGHPHPVQVAPSRPRVVPPTARRFATWVVSHKRHRIVGEEVPEELAERLREIFTAQPAEFRDFAIPQLTHWVGDGEVVIVSPSMAAGGIKHDGAV
jgi:hypothetical protein